MDESLLQPVKLKPTAVPRMWGGHDMKPLFGACDMTEPVGEYWLASGHPNATSVVEGGPLAGLSLTQLTERFPEGYLGVSPQPRFPLLVKLIEARLDLSVQVHPDDTYAMDHENDYGKTEAWYILKAPEAGKVVYGHEFQNRDEYLGAVQQGRVREFLKYQSIQPDDLVYVPARTLHALLGGTTLIEVQQTSDVTYRVYDWDRVDSNGRSRQLHVDKAADVLSYGTGRGDAGSPVQHPDSERTNESRPQLVRAQGTCDGLLQCPFFRIDRVHLGEGQIHDFSCTTNPTLMVCVSGTARLSFGRHESQPVRQGDTWLLPRGGKALFSAEDGFTALFITY